MVFVKTVILCNLFVCKLLWIQCTLRGAHLFPVSRPRRPLQAAYEKLSLRWIKNIQGILISKMQVGTGYTLPRNCTGRLFLQTCKVNWLRSFDENIHATVKIICVLSIAKCVYWILYLYFYSYREALNIVQKQNVKQRKLAVPSIFLSGNNCMLKWHIAIYAYNLVNQHFRY